MLTDKELEEIRRKMLELEEEPPVGSWRSIQAEVQPKRDWRPWWWLLSLLLLILIGTGIYQLQQEAPRAGGEVAESQHEGPVAAALVKPEITSTERGPTVAKQPARRPGAASTVIQEQETVKETLMQPGQQSAPETATTVAEEEKPESEKRAIPIAVPAVVLNQGKTPDALIAPENHEKEVERNSTVPAAAVSPELAAIPPSPLHAGAQVENETTEQKVADETTVHGASFIGSLAQEAAKDTALQEVLAPAALVASGDTATKKRRKPASLEKREPSRNEWTAGVYFAPRYAFRKFVPNAKDDILITGVSNVNQLDPERLGYEFGANFSRVIKPGLFLEAGLSWMQLKENVAYTITTGDIDTFQVKQSGSGQITVESKLITQERQLISSYAYGGLRLGATYYFLENRNRRLNITMAGGANLLIKGRTNHYIDGEWIETLIFPSKENILEQSNYNLQVGIGYNVSVLQRYELSCMPTMSYFLGSTFKEREPLGLKPYSLGVNVQLKRRFNM